MNATVAMAALAVSAANAAPVVHVVGAGSSALWQTAGYGAWKDLAGSGALHWTAKGTTAAGNNFAQLHDSRNAAIPNQGGNIWIVWDSKLQNVWTDISVDSVVGNRAFFAAPRATLQIDASAQTTAGQGLIAATLWGADAASVPTAIYAAINNHAITTAVTDIRPEDAKYAQNRANSPLTSNYSGLGYNTSNPNIGKSILSAYSTASAVPVNFNITGKDPFTGDAVPAYATISVGASPIVFIINRTDASGLGAPGVFKNIELANVQDLFNGTECDTNAFGETNPPANKPVTVVLREPISGTMNTTEFTNFRIHSDPNNSQEVGVNPASATGDPLNQTCSKGGGARKRAIGTGEVVNTAVLANADSIGYAFFGYGNFSKIAGTPNYGYLELNGVDPIFASYTNGELPTCTAPCPTSGANSFPNLRNGTYRSWSILRVVTDASGTNFTNTSSLVTAIQNEVDATVPDFVPTKAVGTDPGLKLYRSHYAQSGIQPNNGLSGQKESGGDMGGCIETITAAPGVLNCHQ